LEQSGVTVHLDDSAKQIDLTMDVIMKMLRRENYSWSEVTRMIVCYRHAADLPLWEIYCRRHGMPEFPAVLLLCEVCRDDLLFEVELDLVSVKGC